MYTNLQKIYFINVSMRGVGGSKQRVAGGRWVVGQLSEQAIR
jgi:hypothetical protein